jgi:SAM-dependent methyltransferase
MAADYDAAHVTENDEHFVAARYASYLLAGIGATSLLDVGAGTGRAVRFFLANNPDMTIVGIEPVRALINQAAAAGVPPNVIIQGRGENLPFDTGSFDAVSAFGTFHHVGRPQAVLQEMLRVARRAVFVSDSNRFGSGRKPLRIVKLALATAGFWDAANWLKTRGKGYTITEGDGLAYSYSVFDSVPAIAKWSDRVILVPTGRASGAGLYHPLLTAAHILVAGIRELPEMRAETGAG